MLRYVIGKGDQENLVSWKTSPDFFLFFHRKGKNLCTHT